MNAIQTLAKKIGWFQLVVTTGLLSGYSPIASGTAGTVVAIPLYLLLVKAGWIPYFVATALLFWLGMQGANRIEQATGKKDHGIIVIDEIIGYLITMAFLPQTWLFVILGFFVFRFFDILKPYPIRKIDLNQNLKGFGVMADDALAGVYGNILLLLVAKLIQ